MRAGRYGEVLKNCGMTKVYTLHQAGFAAKPKSDTKV